MKTRNLLLPLALLLFSGCTALGKLSSIVTPASTPIVQAGVDIAVATAIGNDPLTQKLKAIALKAIAVQVAADASNPAVTISQLESTLNTKIAALAPNPGDLAAFMILTQSLQAFLNQKIAGSSAGAITQQTSVAITGLANAVATACSFYGA